MANEEELQLRIVVDTSGIAGIQRIESSFKSSMSHMSSAISDVVKTAGSLAISLAGIEGATKSLLAGFNFDSQMQQAQISFETMLGSAEKAQKMIGDLQKFAAETPFEFPDLQAGAKKMLAFGFAADSILPMLKAVGDAASGLGMSGKEGIDRIVLALGQMQAKGKVSAEEMLQLTEAGIPAWDILAKSIGKTTGETMKLATQGAIPAAQAIQALIQGLEDRFPNMMDKQSQSFAGLMSTIRDNMNMVLGDLVRPEFEYLASTVLPAVIVKMNDFVKVLQSAGTAAAFKTIIPPAVVDGVVVASHAISAAFGAIANNMNIIIPAAVGLTAAFATYRTVMLASTIATTAQAVALALQTGAVALSTRGTSAFTLANIAATASAVASTLATEGLAAAFTALAAAMNLNPVVLAITAAMAVLAGAVYVVYNNWDAFKTWCINLWNSIVNFIADNIGTIIALFPGLAAAVYVIYTGWQEAVALVKALWTGLADFVAGVASVLGKIIDSISEAWPKFVDAAKVGISRFISALADLAERFVPDWAKSLYGKIVDLGNALAGKTAEIGDSIRRNLSITVPAPSVGMADLRKQDDSNTQPSVQTSSSSAGGASGIDWSSLGAATTGHKDRGFSAYDQAKKDYEEQAALEDADAKRKAELWQQYLADVEKTEKEAADYRVNLARLTTAAKKEQIDIDRANLEKEIAEGKAKTLEAYDNKISLLQREVDLTKEGSAERIKAETAVINAQKEKEQYMLDIEKERQDRLQQHLLAEIDLDDQKNQTLKDNYAITEEQLTQLTEQNEDKRYQIKKDALEKSLLAAKNDEKEQEKIKTQLLQLEDQYTAKKLQLQQKAYQEEHQYQFAAIDGFQSGLDKILQGFIHWNMTVKEMFRTLGQSILESVGNAWVKSIVDRWSTGFAKMVGITQADNSKEIALEQAKQASLTSVAIAGNTARITASKVASATAAASGAATATSIVAANAAAFTALLAMIAAVASSIATIPPAGPAMAAAMLAGVGVATGTLTASTASATAAISSSVASVASFDVGTWSVPQDMLAVVHKGEPIIPTPFADKARAVLSGEMVPASTASSSTFSPVIQITANAIDSRGMKKVLASSSKDMVNILNKEWRNFNRKK